MRNAILRSSARRAAWLRVLFLLMFCTLQQAAFAIQPLLNAQQVAAGGFHVCAIVNGGAQCWGYNYDGQLGNGNYLESSMPVPVKGLQSGVTSIVAGVSHTCAIANGAVKCWGRNPEGQLGNGSINDSNVPVTVQGLSGVTAIYAGGYHTCARINDGSVKCWGWNGYGQLGDGTVNSTYTGLPTTVTSLGAAATMLTGGERHTCALVGGAVKCWGYNPDGELGNNSIADSHVPVVVPALASGVTSIASGSFHTCAVVSGGAVHCWGYNSSGQLGNNSVTSTGAGNPVTVSGLSGVAALAGGGYHTCAVVAGAEKCWGYDVFGALGIGSTTDSHVPVTVSGLGSGVTAITAGLYHSCAQVTSGGTSQTHCWGNNIDGELGLGDLLFRSIPVAVSGISSGATALATSSIAVHSCAIVGGAARCWGNNVNGALGNGTTNDSSVPVSVTGLNSGVTAIADGGYHTCAVVSGKAMCWGLNSSGQLGNSSTTDSTTPVTAIGSGVTAIGAGYAHSCAIVGGGVKCWGNNASGELGDGTTVPRQTPVSVQGLSGTAIAISVGVAHTCVVITGGTIQCWGYNSNGQLGNATNVATTTNPPVTVHNIASGATSIAAGGYHTCAVVNGGVQCWGDDQAGQLGNGAQTDSFVPVPATGLSSGVGSVVAGNSYSCALVSGAVYCWGDSYSLGGGAADLLTTPTLIPLGASASAIGTADSHGCAIIGGAVLCVGADNFGELGDGRSVFLTSPGIVLEGDEIFPDNFEGN